MIRLASREISRRRRPSHVAGVAESRHAVSQLLPPSPAGADRERLEYISQDGWEHVKCETTIVITTTKEQG